MRFTTFEQSLALEQAGLSPPGWRGGRAGGSRTALYQHLGRPVDAIHRLEQAIAVMDQTGLPQDAAGQTPEKIRALLDTMRQGDAPAHATSAVQTMPPEQSSPPRFSPSRGTPTSSCPEKARRATVSQMAPTLCTPRRRRARGARVAGAGASDHVRERDPARTRGLGSVRGRDRGRTGPRPSTRSGRSGPDAG